MLLDDDDDADLGPQIVEGSSSFQAAADFEVRFTAASMAPTGAVADSERLRNKNMSDTRDSGLVGENGQSNDLRHIFLYLQKVNAALRASCSAENAALAMSLLEVRTLWI